MIMHLTKFFWPKTIAPKLATKRLEKLQWRKNCKTDIKMRWVCVGVCLIESAWMYQIERERERASERESEREWEW
jgi:hypothetical protein